MQTLKTVFKQRNSDFKKRTEYFNLLFTCIKLIIARCRQIVYWVYFDEIDLYSYLREKLDIPDLYHLNPSQEKDSQLLCNNVAENSLFPIHSEVRKGEVQILTRSQTLNISRKFKNENSALFRKLFVLLLNLMFNVFC